jgi:precorrin-6A/cobalt-precorrin-6A reductase
VILVLGGTAQARELADALHAAGVPVTTSLAGRVARPRLPRGAVRIGGFGGPDAMAGWLAGQRVDAVVDATHPFAERISASASRACGLAGVPLMRLERPGWSERPGDSWIWAADLPAAAAAIPPRRRVFLTTGRQGLAAFAAVASAWFLIRCVDPPQTPLPPRSTVLLDRGPFTLAGELALIDAHAIDLLITKDSGGEHTAAKLDAARRRGIEVIVVQRPARRAGRLVQTTDEALAWALAATGAAADSSP